MEWMGYIVDERAGLRGQIRAQAFSQAAFSCGLPSEDRYRAGIIKPPEHTPTPQLIDLTRAATRPSSRPTRAIKDSLFRLVTALCPSQ